MSEWQARNPAANGAESAAGLQGHGYRRGFVLGLTLAETALLLIFVLMLLLVVGFERRDRIISTQQALVSAVESIVPLGVAPVAYLSAQLAVLRQLQEAASASGHDWDEDFIELVRAVAEMPPDSGLVDARKAVDEQQRRLEQMMALVQGMQGEADIKELVTRLADSEAASRNQRGQLVSLREQLERAGLSGVLPSCWTTPDGRIDYILDVVLDSRGIRVRESSPPHRADERARLPMKPFDAALVYAQGEFSAATQALYNWSVANECRFYVTIYDDTGPHEKDLYKRLLDTVEGHFYKRMARSASPF
jgi:hypothetical protein